MALPILAHWAGRSIFDIEPAALARRGIRLLLADLDNTLAPYGEPEPTQAVRDRRAGNPGRYLRYGAEWPFRMWSKRRTKPL